ncbi:hypothetical protein K443DRAFT_83938 [Laccaria amethystina LaAM-08-1]|uniref:Endoplasmic reticulum-based factor for assembly of V-ATPase n=1 Tax=Laccaria amethystina LaAM-08-1 TaxID=1095629 RepID=A0A0C9YLW9_9AGAR|nr:hypothetical protein K443DRAFT_83938 [Laccaria amethystina LaAM-08-1]
MNANSLNISLESHLHKTLIPLVSLLPASESVNLQLYISDPPPSTIPYNVLQTISQWSRTSTGQKALRANSLDPQDYTMIAMLAGATTSPEGKFGDYTPPKGPQAIEADRAKERKAITALLNALLSIGGAAFATWWAADKLRWTNEWRVLLSLCVAMIVAISEGVLYVIWESQQDASKRNQGTRRLRSATHKKDDGETSPANLPDDLTMKVDSTDESANLRRRR